jgi:sucrose-6-phosphatase
LNLTDESARRSLQLLHDALHPEGFQASPSNEHYAALWARDAAMACLGATRSADDTLIDGVETTLRTLSSLATPHGQIPNAYWPGRRYWDWGEAGAIDSSPWFVIALADHVATTGRVAIGSELWASVERALGWLAYQDVTATSLVDSPAGGDWMDSSLNRSGRVLHVNVLYHWAAASAARLARLIGAEAPVDPEPIATAIDTLFWPKEGTDLASLITARYPPDATAVLPHPLSAHEYARLANPNRRHYLASVSYGRFVDRCDVLAHCLGIASGLIDGDRAGVVLDFLDERACAEPYPSRSWPEPFLADDLDGLLDADADARQDPRWRNPPGSYHNGGVWPYVGAAHALAAHVAGRAERASALLNGVAAANRLNDWAFTEWIKVPSGEPRGARDQVWNAGAYLWAYSEIFAGG